MVVERDFNGEIKSGCNLITQLNSPSNINQDDIDHYIVDYQLGTVMISGTLDTFIVRNCTPDLRIKITAVNRCGTLGNSSPDIIPIFLPDSGAMDAPEKSGM